MVEFEDGSEEGQYSANIILHNMISRRIDSDGNHEEPLLLRQLVDHRKKPDAIPKDLPMSRLAERKSFRERRKAGIFVLSGLMAELLGYP